MSLDAMKTLLESADAVLEMGLDACRDSDLAEYKNAQELIKGGAVQRLVIDVRDGSTVINAILIGRGDPVCLFQYTARSVGERH